MEKTTTLNLRVNPGVKQQAESVLSRLGVPISTAVNMFLNQICLTGGIPFNVSLPAVPISVNADCMSANEIHRKLQEGISSANSGITVDAEQAFATFMENVK